VGTVVCLAQEPANQDKPKETAQEKQAVKLTDLKMVIETFRK
jgi:hypothetical protein